MAHGPLTQRLLAAQHAATMAAREQQQQGHDGATLRELRQANQARIRADRDRTDARGRGEGPTDQRAVTVSGPARIFRVFGGSV